MKKQTKSVVKNTSIRLSPVDVELLEELRWILSPHVRLSDNKVISAALKIARESLPSEKSHR